MKLKQVLRRLINWLDIWEETLWVMRHPKIYHNLISITRGSLKNAVDSNKK